VTVPTISNLPTVPATSDPNFETEAPALFNHIKNTFVSEMNSAISFINSSTFDATVEFKDDDFTAARNFLYMIDTSSGGVSVTLPANPSTGDQLLLMDQKRSFGTNNLTIGRNSQNINGSASDVVSKSTGALIRCIFQASYGWTVDLYEGEWESGTSAGDLVYNGGNVGIGTSAPSAKLDIFGANPVIEQSYSTSRPDADEYIAGGLESYFLTRDSNNNLGAYIHLKDVSTNSSFPTAIRGGEISFGTIDGGTGFSGNPAIERMRITAYGNVELPKLAGRSYSLPSLTSVNPNLVTGTNFNSIPVQVGDEITFYNNQVRTVTAVTNTQLTVDQNWTTSFAATSATGKAGIGFNTKDTERMRITADGNVGIGTNKPQEKLDLYGNLKLGTSGNDGVIRAWTSRGADEGGNTTSGRNLILKAGIGTGAPSGANGQIEFHTEHGTLNYGNGTPHGSGSAKMVIKSTGEVGIGTSAPDAKLEIDNGGVGEYLRVGGDDSDNARALKFTSSNSSTGSIGALHTIKANSTAGEIAFDNGNGNIMYLKNDGNVGIGTSAPSDKLSLNDTESNTSITLQSNNQSRWWITADGTTTTPYTNVLKIGGIGGSEPNEGVININGSGNVGIGTSSPAQPLHVLKADGAAYGIFDSYRENQFGGGINIAHARGTESSPDFLNANDYLGLYSFGGWQGSGFARYAEVHALATQNHSATAGGTKLVLQTTANDTVLKQNRLVIDQAGDVQISTGNLVIGTAGKGIDFSATSGTGTSEILTDYEQGTFTPAFIDTNGDASFTHDVQKGRYTKIGDCVYFQLFIGTDAVTEGTGSLKISGLPFTAQNTDGQLTPSSSVGLNYSWDTSPIKWSIASNSDAIILYKSVNPLTPSASTDLRTTANTNRISIEGFYHV